MMNDITLNVFSNEFDKYDYVGWIPCVTGRLTYANAPSVTALGNVEKPRSINKCIDEPTSANHRCRVLAVNSTHDWKDTKSKHKSGVYNVFLAGRADSCEEHCVFKIHLGFVLERMTDVVADTTTLFDRLIERAEDESPTEPESVYDLFTAFESSLIDNCKEENKGYYLIEMLLHPNGLVLCRYIDRGPADKEAREKNKGCYMRRRIIAARQAYYYAKYVFHQHKHHLPTIDCACTIIPMPTNKVDIGPKLVGNLTGGINQFRRHLDQLGQGDIHHDGIVGYTASLAKSCLRVQFQERSAYRHQMERLGFVNQSFGAMVKERTFNRVSNIQWTTAFLQLASILLLMLGTYFILQKIPGQTMGRAYLIMVLVVVASWVAVLIMHHIGRSISRFHLPIIRFLFGTSTWQLCLILAIGSLCLIWCGWKLLTVVWVFYG